VQAEIDIQIEELHQMLMEDVDNHYWPGRECLTDAHHFELWDRMMELEGMLEKKRGSPAKG